MELTTLILRDAIEDCESMKFDKEGIDIIYFPKLDRAHVVDRDGEYWFKAVGIYDAKDQYDIRKSWNLTDKHKEMNLQLCI